MDLSHRREGTSAEKWLGDRFSCSATSLDTNPDDPLPLRRSRLGGEAVDSYRRREGINAEK